MVRPTPPPIDARARGATPRATHDVVTVAGHGGYPIGCRHWRGEEARATLVLAHGVVGHSLWLEPIARRLARRGVATLAMDRRGAGINDAARGDAPSAEALIADLVAVLRHASADALPLHVGGFCWGSNYVVNALAALDAPTATALDLRSVIHIAPSLFPSPLVRERPFRVGDDAAPSEAPAMPIERFTDGPLFASFIVPDPLRLRAVSPRLNGCVQRFAAGLWLKLLRCELPCLLLLAADDAVVDNAATERLFARLTARPKRIRTLPGAHGVQFDAPKAAATLVADWVQELGEARSVPCGTGDTNGAGDTGGAGGADEPDGADEARDRPGGSGRPTV